MIRVLPNSQKVNSGNWEVEELLQDGYALRQQMVKVEHRDPVRHLGDERDCLPYGRCAVVSHQTTGSWGHKVVLVDCPHEPSKKQVLRDCGGIKLPINDANNHLQTGMGFSDGVG